MYIYVHYYIITIAIIIYNDNDNEHDDMHIYIYICLIGGDWNMAFMTFHLLGITIPTDELIFSEG